MFIQKTYLYILFLSLGAFICSCSDYSSRVPLSNSKKTDIDSNLIGRWVKVHDEYAEAKTEKLEIFEKFHEHFLDVIAFNQNEYVLRVFNEKGDQFVARGFENTIENKRYSNIQLLNYKSQEFFIYKFEFKNDTLIYYPIKKDVFSFQFKKSKNFRKALIKASQNTQLYGEPRKYIKLSNPKLY
jgi:hypothetical protein